MSSRIPSMVAAVESLSLQIPDATSTVDESGAVDTLSAKNYPRGSLPMDLVIDGILTRTSPVTVAKTRTLCKELNEATHQWNFVEKFHRRTEMVNSFFFQDQEKCEFRQKYLSTEATEGKGGPGEPTLEKQRDLSASKELSLAFIPGYPVKIEAATKQGLFLCRGEAPKRPWIQFFVCKPTTQEWVKIPSPKTRYFTEKFAMMVVSSSPSKLHYKIVRFSKPEPSCVSDRKNLYVTHGCEIFDSATWAWRTLPEKTRVPYGEIVLFGQPVVSTARFFYALTSECRVLAFDWDTESYDIISLPAPLLGDDQRLKLFECEGKLGVGLMAESETEMELWVLERAGVKAWNMRKRVNIECLTGNGDWCYALAMPSSDVIVFRTSCGIKFVRFGNCDSSKTQIVKRVDCNNYFFELFWI